MRNAIQSRKSTKTAAVVTGTFVAQYPSEHAEEARVAFPAAVDQGTVRRAGPVIERTLTTGLIELRCPVEYGPVFGAHESDLKQRLDRIKDDTNAAHAVVFDYKRREVTTADLDEMAAKVDDGEVPLEQRKYLADLLAKLRR